MFASNTLARRSADQDWSAGAGLGLRVRVALRDAFRGGAVGPIAVALATFLVHGRALWNGFVDWDDQVNFLTNEHYRGLGWTHLHWMFTTVLMGQWIPVTWITLGADYLLWGMNPRGYHLTSVALHAANAAVFWLVARRILQAAAPHVPTSARLVGVTGAVMFFAIHPLRAESVAWVTERRDVLSGLFFLLAVLFYLIRHDAGNPRERVWFGLSLAAFALACLSKSMVVTLPPLLILLDIYPFRRLHWHPAAWRTPAARRVLLEKVPYAALALVTAAMALYAQVANRYLTPFDTLPPLARIPVALYGLWFYVSRTVVPLELSPLYELPAHVNPLELRFLGAAVGVIGLTAIVVLLRRRWPAGLAAWTAYVVMVTPVSGVLHNGHQLAHDRYSYLSCLPWALLFGAAMSGLLVAARRRVIRRVVAQAAVVTVSLWLAGLAVMTWHQISVWHDNDSLWRYALEADADCAICHSNLGVSLYNRRILPPAIERFERSIALRPDRVKTQGNLGLAFIAIGRPAEAVPRFERLLERYPADNDARVNLAIALLQTDRREDAIARLHEVLERDPQHALALTNLASALLESGEADAALEQLERAAQVKPDLLQVRVGLFRTYLALDRPDAAREQLERLRALDPVMANGLGPALVTAW
jgi:tetratricopeptide (TPR) repeat protein